MFVLSTQGQAGAFDHGVGSRSLVAVFVFAFIRSGSNLSSFAIGQQ